MASAEKALPNHEVPARESGDFFIDSVSLFSAELKRSRGAQIVAQNRWLFGWIFCSALDLWQPVHSTCGWILKNGAIGALPCPAFSL